MTGKQIAREIGIWTVTVILVLMFGNAGIRKFFEHGGWTRMFHNLGFPDWFRILIGVVETAAAAMLLWTRTAAYGAALMMIVMTGAIATMALHGWTRALPPPAVALTLAVLVLWMRWRQRATIPFARPSPPSDERQIES
ncbi:MAG TPA: DoxX family protein [Thermoanaerobaculia bacterium]|jgi:uncharacterized membrane protein YphA (DoxX/SURF4 family)